MYLVFSLSFGVLVGDFHYRPCVITMVSVSSAYYTVILGDHISCLVMSFVYLWPP